MFPFVLLGILLHCEQRDIGTHLVGNYIHKSARKRGRSDFVK